MERDVVDVVRKWEPVDRGVDLLLQQAGGGKQARGRRPSLTQSEEQRARQWIGVEHGSINHNAQHGTRQVVDPAPCDEVLTAMEPGAALEISATRGPGTRVDQTPMPLYTVVAVVHVVCALEEGQHQERDASPDHHNEHGPLEVGKVHHAHPWRGEREG